VPDKQVSNFVSFIKPLAYGLSGSNFICVMQFLYDTRVPPIALVLLIGSIPPLIVIGVVLTMLEARPPPHPDPVVNGELVAMFAFILFGLCSLLGYGRLFSVVNVRFLGALLVGMIAVLVVLSIINRVLKKGD